MQRRSGFTLTDLVVGLFCLGITSAVAAPMLLQVQERANLERCANNLKQIGIAAHNYHGDFDKLPPGYLGPMDKGKGPAPSLDKPEETLNVGSLALLLPYLEQDNLFKQFRDTASTGNEGLNLSLTANVPAWWRRGENLQVAQTNLQKIFHCPSDPWEDTPSTGILAAFHCAEGKMQQHILDGSRATILGRTNYTGVAGLWGRSENPFARHFEGVLFNRSKLTLGQIVVQDGTSNTLMFGEGVGGLPRKPRDTAWSWMGVGSMACPGSQRRTGLSVLAVSMRR
jgi:type II secretory pathway pseudopilin PulG